MKRFARLLDQLSYQSQRNAKLRLVADYFATAPDPDRGYALAALTGDLVFRHAKAGLFRDLAAARTDPVLFALSYDYVGDLAETVALIWPQRPNDSPPPDLATIVETLEVSPKAKLPEIVADWLDRLDAVGALGADQIHHRGLCASASRRASPRPRWRAWASSIPTRWRRSGMRSRSPIAASSNGSRARGPSPRPAAAPPSARPCWPSPWRRTISPS